MPDKTGRLTRQERLFAERYAATGDAPYAAEKAGYASPIKRASQNLAKPAVVEASRKAARRLLNEQGALLGVSVLMEIASDPKQPAGARRAAASDLVKHSGISSSSEADEKEMHEMSYVELQRRAAVLRSRTEALEQERVERDRPQLDLQAEPAGEGVFG